MVYKIVGNIDDGVFRSVIDFAQKFYRIMIKNGNVYIALNNYDDYERAEKELKEWKGKWSEKEVYVIKIDEFNLKKEDQEIIDWCRNNLVRIDTARYEADNQNNLKKMYEAIDLFEIILADEIKNQEKIKDKIQEKEVADGEGKEE